MVSGKTAIGLGLSAVGVLLLLRGDGGGATVIPGSGGGTTTTWIPFSDMSGTNRPNDQRNFQESTGNGGAGAAGNGGRNSRSAGSESRGSLPNPPNFTARGGGGSGKAVYVPPPKSSSGHGGSPNFSTRSGSAVHVPRSGNYNPRNYTPTNTKAAEVTNPVNTDLSRFDFFRDF